MVTPSPLETMTVREMRVVMDERERANNQRFEAQEKAVAAALAAAEKAVTKAETAAEKRFDSVNEFRNTLKDQQLTFVTRTEVDLRFKSQDEKISGYVRWLWGAVISAGGLAVSIAALVLSRR